MKILILGGIKEAGQLAIQLVNDGHEVISSLAGRTKEPHPVAGEMRIGGFGGVDGMVEFIIENRIEKVIDCTHPFARQISANAKLAAQKANVPLEVIVRPPWSKEPGDQWGAVNSLEEARENLKPGSRVLLALGSQHIDLFKSRDDVFFLVRMVDMPKEEINLPNHRLLIGKPSPDWQKEAEILQNNNISHIVCRNSGGRGAYAKIEAARHLGLPVVMVQR